MSRACVQRIAWGLVLALLVVLVASGLAPQAMAREGQPPTRLVIPAIKLNAAVEVATVLITPDGPVWDVPQDAAGWHVSSTLPGETGNLVLSGHHNTGGRVFRNLHDVVAGDLVYVVAGQEIHVYVVTERVILREDGVSPEQRQANAQWIRATQDERLTLVTCYPWWTNTHRLIVVATPLENSD
jgi:LPXTG-site transpeptidase (sortase) family protein